MRLFPPDPDIKLYETGFGIDDQFNRNDAGKSLSDLVERIENPLVIALNGEWGSGKTWFLKRWVGAHKLENGGRASTVYFDAFAHDFMDDPLIALTGVIGDHLPKKSESKAWDKVKMAAAKLAKPATRIGMAAATGGATELVGPTMDAAAEAVRKEVETAAEAFWVREDGKRAAMHQLRTALIELTRVEIESGDKPVPLVVVVDELDRCRPDYALTLLEVIKHFFSVPNVHFVLGVNLDALGQSVRSRYGVGLDADKYLRKFISLAIELPVQTNDHDATPLVLKYFRRTGSSMGMSDNVIDVLDRHLRLFAQNYTLTMRDINQLLSRLVLVNSEVFTTGLWGWKEILVSMVLFRFATPEMERKALDKTLTINDVEAFYGIKPDMLNEDDRDLYDHSAMIISGLWEHIISNGAGSAGSQRFAGAFDAFGSRNAQRVPRVVHSKYISNFVFVEEK